MDTGLAGLLTMAIEISLKESIVFNSLNFLRNHFLDQLR